MIRLLVQRGPSVLLLVLAIVAFGVLSYATLPREAAPDIKIPVVMVTTPYLGVSPADIESLITIPIENELSGVKDLKKMSSTSAEGFSLVSLEFEPDVVIEEALQRVRDRVDKARPGLPGDAEDPAIREIAFSDFPILMVTIAGGLDEERLKDIAEPLQEKVKRIPGVLDAALSGGLERQVRVQVDPRRLTRYGLSLDDVTGAISAENVNIPGGDVTAGSASFLVRIPGELKTADQIEGVAVKRRGDRPVFVRDLASVIDGYADRETYARMNGAPAVTLAITKRAGASIIAIADEVRALTAAESADWPEGVEVRLLADQSRMIRDMVSDLENNIVTALLLVVAVVMLFMGPRNSLFVAAAIPLSMLMSFALIEFFGMTLNMVVLFSLILALGMLVDNAIVIVENVYRHMEEGKDLVAASVDGTREVAMAVAASTATTVAAFFPLVFWTGIMGKFMGFLPKTVIIVLISSLVVAIAVLPVATSVLLKKSRHRKPDITESRSPILLGYRKVLEFSIRHHTLSALAMVAVLVGTFMAYGELNHGTEFFPDTEPNRATIGLRAPDGTDLEHTDRMVRRIEAVLAGEPNVDVFVAESGVAGGGNPMEAAAAQTNQARITIDFLPDRNNAAPGQTVRVEPTTRTIDRLRAALRQIPGAEISVDKEQMGPPVGAPISVQVSGEDFHAVGELAARLRREIAAVSGVTELRDDYRVGRPELRLRIDRGAAKRVGASTRKIANTVRMLVAGSKVSAIRDGKDETDIVVEAHPRFRDNIQDVLALRIPGREDTSPDTFQVPLSAVASYELVGGSGSIRHVDQDLVVTITGDVAEGYNQNAVRGEVIALLGSWREQGRVPEGFAVALGGADDEQRQAQEFLGRAFLSAVLLISLVLVTQFNSFSTPAIIMASVILSLVGVLWGLVITGTPFGVIMTGLGVISLAGVVVNNAIVLLDYVEQLRDEGLGVEDALVRAGLVRFRPVMLTAITTVLGLVPMAVGVSWDFRNWKPLIGGSNAAFWGPMAVAVIFGLVFATVLTLVMVPTFYSLMHAIGQVWRRLRARVTGAAAIGLVVFTAGDAQAMTLDEIQAAARAHSVQVALAEEQIVQAESLVTQAWASLGPSVIGKGGYTVNQSEIAFDMSETLPEQFAASLEDSEPFVIQEKEFFDASLIIAQPLFDPRALPALRATQRRVSRAQAETRRAEQQLRGQVARACTDLDRARRAAALSVRGVAAARQHHELARRQVEAGLRDRRASLQAEVALAEAERELARTREGLAGAGLRFAQLTGLSRDVEITLPAAPASPASLAEALDAAQTARPDLAAAHLQVEELELLGVGLRLQRLPELDGTFIASYTENSGFSDEPTTWMAKVEATWPLWANGFRVARDRGTASQVRSATLMVTLRERMIEQDVSAAWERLQQVTVAHQAIARTVALAREGLELAQRAKAAGSGGALDVSDAELMLLRTELALASEAAEIDLARVDLAVAMGRY